MPDSDPDLALPRVGLLRCFTCNKTVQCQPEDLLRYTRSRWPRCCDDVMALFTPADVDKLTRALTPPLGMAGLPE